MHAQDVEQLAGQLVDDRPGLVEQEAAFAVLEARDPGEDQLLGLGR
jgi:hypothetical protein